MVTKDEQLCARDARHSGRRLMVWTTLGALLVAALVYLMATAHRAGRPDRGRPPQSHATVVFNSAIIVFREGLEAVLIFAAVTASFLGANKPRRRPVVLGAALAFAAAVVTWFLVQALLDVASPLGPRLEAITGFIAIVVLLVVLNWFVHKVYWSEWIGSHHRQRRKLLARTGIGATLGLVALGFTSVYREGFEVVLFLQNLELKAGIGRRARGRRARPRRAPRSSASLTFWLHHKLPYRKMLVAHRRARRRRARGDDRRHRADASRSSAGCRATRRRSPSRGGWARGSRCTRLGDARRAGAGRRVRHRLLLRGPVRQGQAPARGSKRPSVARRRRRSSPSTPPSPRRRGTTPR